MKLTRKQEAATRKLMKALSEVNKCGLVLVASGRDSLYAITRKSWENGRNLSINEIINRDDDAVWLPSSLMDVGD